MIEWEKPKQEKTLFYTHEYFHLGDYELCTLEAAAFNWTKPFLLIVIRFYIFSFARKRYLVDNNICPFIKW